MTNRERGGRAAALATTLLVVCCVVITGLLVRREIAPPRSRGPSTPLKPLANWESYAAFGHWIGPTDARAVLVEFADFQCPACRGFEATLRELRTRYPKDFAIVFRHLPLDRIHPQARHAAFASECAARQGRFESMHGALFDRRDSLGILPWRAFASQAGVPDLDEFDRCLTDSTKSIALIKHDVDAAQRLGARGTPTGIINGVRFDGALSEPVLDSLVREAIHQASARR